MVKKPKIIPLFRENYLAMVEKSVGARMFRNLFAEVSGKKQDITENGILSCAYFVSSILVIFDLIKKIHATVGGTVKDMKKCGWKEIKRPRKGSVLVWEAKDFDGEHHQHIGFFIGDKQAVSNSYRKRVPVIHHWTFKGERKIEAIFWHQKLEKN